MDYSLCHAFWVIFTNLAYRACSQFASKQRSTSSRKKRKIETFLIKWQQIDLGNCRDFQGLRMILVICNVNMEHLSISELLYKDVLQKMSIREWMLKVYKLSTVELSSTQGCCLRLALSLVYEKSWSIFSLVPNSCWYFDTFFYGPSVLKLITHGFFFRVGIWSNFQSAYN